MSRKNTGKSYIPKSKSSKVQSYKLMLGQRSVSGTVRHRDTSFDDTATSYSSYEEDDLLIEPEQVPKQNILKWFQNNTTSFGVIFAVILALCGAVYKFASLEQNVEYVHKRLTEIQQKIFKIEEDHKKDYQALDGILKDHLSKSKK